MADPLTPAQPDQEKDSPSLVLLRKQLARFSDFVGPLFPKLSSATRTIPEILDDFLQSNISGIIAGCFLFVIGLLLGFGMAIAIALSVAYLLLLFWIVRYKRVRAMQSSRRGLFVLGCTIVLGAIFAIGGPAAVKQLDVKNKLASEPTSAIDARVVELSFTADEPVKEKIEFVSNSAQTLKVYSVRQHFAAILPRNPDSLAWYINQKWDQFFSYQRLGRTMLIEPHVVSYIPTDPQHFEDWPVVTSAMIKRAKATGGIVSFVLMGLFQYTDTTGLHETDYCAIARGENGPVVDCNTHLGPSKPTPLQ